MRLPDPGTTRVLCSATIVGLRFRLRLRYCDYRLMVKSEPSRSFATSTVKASVAGLYARVYHRGRGRGRDTRSRLNASR